MCDLQKLDESGVAIIGKKFEKQMLKVGDGSFTDDQTSKLIGLKPGELSKLDLPDNEDKTIKNPYELTVVKVEREVLPELNDDFVKMVNPDLKSVDELNLIVKSDVHGSSEAIKNAISQIKHDEVKPKIILADIGMVTETDVTLAKASNAVLIAFNVKPSKEAKKLAEIEKIKISSYNIIYEVLDYIKQKMSGLLSPDVKETIIGSAQILEIFKVSGAGKVAGSKIIEGEINSTSDVRIIRDGTIIYTGKVGTLFREKNQVKQVSNGQECGITVKDYLDFKKNDTIEAFNVTSTERSI